MFRRGEALTVRSFLAAILEPETVAALRSWAEAARGFPGRAVPETNWHLTLAFLGDLERERVALARDRFAELETLPAVTFTLDRWWLLPEPDRAGVLAVGGVAVAPDGPGAALASAVRALQQAHALGRAGPRPFLPHVTLRRLKPPFRGAAPSPAPACRCPVRRLGLFESRRDAKGSSYLLLETYHLRD
jgi:2'-5' RNA ligase